MPGAHIRPMAADQVPGIMILSTAVAAGDWRCAGAGHGLDRRTGAELASRSRAATANAVRDAQRIWLGHLVKDMQPEEKRT